MQPKFFIPRRLPRPLAWHNPCLSPQALTECHSSALAVTSLSRIPFRELLASSARLGTSRDWNSPAQDWQLRGSQQMTVDLITGTVTSLHPFFSRLICHLTGFLPSLTGALNTAEPRPSFCGSFPQPGPALPQRPWEPLAMEHIRPTDSTPAMFKCYIQLAQPP